MGKVFLNLIAVCIAVPYWRCPGFRGLELHCSDNAAFLLHLDSRVPPTTACRGLSHATNTNADGVILADSGPRRPGFYDARPVGFMSAHTTRLSGR